jgi:anti-sigma regulatory factor (Ser/Thr protein kinase)
LPVSPRAAGRARQAVRATLDHDAFSGIVDDAQLLATEIVTNAVRHAGLDKTDWIGLRIDVSSSTVRIEVADAGPSFTWNRRDPALGGLWGLHIVDHIADRWGIEREFVWFELDT